MLEVVLREFTAAPVLAVIFIKRAGMRKHILQRDLEPLDFPFTIVNADVRKVPVDGRGMQQGKMDHVVPEAA
ncbi:MAG TPA: hypothetical protein DER10_11985 [Elusimicrobia bacterium]|nr:hypothetical protein [Elusimicrobiota bacterium]HCE99203.1 hypothetical protein [Elusimicrobiota bacterium]